nr:DegV family protein [Streptococcus mitis]
MELFRELSHHYDAIIPILLSSGISGTYQTVALKEKVYKQLLQKSDGFAGNLFKA